MTLLEAIDAAVTREMRAIVHRIPDRPRTLLVAYNYLWLNGNNPECLERAHLTVSEILSTLWEPTNKV